MFCPEGGECFLETTKKETGVQQDPENLAGPAKPRVLPHLKTSMPSTSWACRPGLLSRAFSSPGCGQWCPYGSPSSGWVPIGSSGPPGELKYPRGSGFFHLHSHWPPAAPATPAWWPPSANVQSIQKPEFPAAFLGHEPWTGHAVQPWEQGGKHTKMKSLLGGGTRSTGHLLSTTVCPRWGWVLRTQGPRRKPSLCTKNFHLNGGDKDIKSHQVV